MHPILKQNLFFIKEHIGMFRAANNFDVYQPDTKELLMTCREEQLGFLTKAFRFTDYKRMTPFHIEIRSARGERVLEVKRGLSLFLSTVEVLDEQGQVVGRFSQKFFSIGGRFDILDPQNRVLCTLKGTWTSWDFSFIQGGNELARVTKKWAGIGRELFTSADNYMLSVNEQVRKDDPVRILILAAVMCIDMVLKE